MKGTSKVIMGVTLLMVVTLAIILALVLVLLAELYCSLLLRRRRRLPVTTTTTNTTSSPQHNHQSHATLPPPLSGFYSQGVIRAPRSFLFPSDSSLKATTDKEQIHQFIKSQIQESNLAPKPTSVPSSSSANPIQRKEFVYISNPIYDNEANRGSKEGTPFQTPDSSPSRLEMSGSSSSDEDIVAQITPPLTPMKKLPEEACSVTLRDARSLGTSGSDSNSNNGVSSSSSGSPCTSPSW